MLSLGLPTPTILQYARLEATTQHDDIDMELWNGMTVGGEVEDEQ